jgi:hypothetical protein
LIAMPGSKTAAIAVCFATTFTAGIAMADDLPASGTYHCVNANGAVADMNFAVGPGNIYTTKKGFRGVMTIHPGTGNVLFHGAAPQSGFQGRYNSGPSPHIALATVKDGVSSDAGITCQMQ